MGSSISVVSAKTLATYNVNTVFDLQYLTPSLQVTPQFGSGQPSFAIRGLGFDDYASNNAPTVGVCVDEVSLPVPFATNDRPRAGGAARRAARWTACRSRSGS